MLEDTGRSIHSGVRVLTPDDNEARVIAKAMASSTAGDILRSFQGREMTASDLATGLKIPIPTLLYHLDSLLEAGLIEVSRIRYSVKGREVKVYRQSDRIVIVAPRHADLKALLLKYASLFGITILGAGVVSLLQPLPSPELMGSGLPFQEMKDARIFSEIA
ncbi:MAG: helix-turn-helix domain-containing protein, partial [Methanospirillum sp.]|uniref:ArsR/SmtB family transcription factor n=1 Tax=Methanospirillum sp. TaxID=45200 RepID=UPI00236C5D7F